MNRSRYHLHCLYCGHTVTWRGFHHYLIENFSQLYYRLIELQIPSWLHRQRVFPIRKLTTTYYRSTEHVHVQTGHAWEGISMQAFNLISKNVLPDTSVSLLLALPAAARIRSGMRMSHVTSKVWQLHNVNFLKIPKLCFWWHLGIP